MAARRLFATASHVPKEVVIVAAARTPVGTFRGALAGMSAPELGTVAIKGALARSGVKPEDVDHVLMGNVISAALGQAPARQAQLRAGIPNTSEATTINKVCASGMKAITMGAQSIMLGHDTVVVAGGMESMSNVPHYLEKAREGFPLGHVTMQDGILRDGLWDVYYNQHMGNCAEETAAKYGITREMQDAHAIESYKRATEANKKGWFKAEIVPITLAGAKGQPETVISEDDEFKRLKLDKVATLKPAFQKNNGTVTAANSSKLNDGASAVILTTAEKAAQMGWTPLARIRGFADAAQDPKDFPTAPAKAVPRALRMAGVTTADISLHEINEAFSVVVRANEKILGLDPAKVNIAGGAVALGHPIGSSGARIVVTLVHRLTKGQLGCASICNGGGGATALVIERL